MSRLRSLFVVLALVACGAVILSTSSRFVPDVQAAAGRLVTIPGEDRFSPYSVVIKVGQAVRFTNNDTDSHYVVSIDAFNTAGNQGTNHLIPPGQSFQLPFNKTGVFPYYCSFHAKLDSTSQPIAPGPFGGIQDGNGNFGTPMNGVVTVVP